MTSHHAPRLPAHADALELAIDMLSLALRDEHDRQEHGRAQLLRARLSATPGPDALRERVGVLSSPRGGHD